MHAQQSHADILAYLLASPRYFPLSATHRLLCELHVPISMPVTLSPRYFSAPSYQSLQFIEEKKNNITKMNTKIYKMNTSDKIDDYSSKTNTSGS